MFNGKLENIMCVDLHSFIASFIRVIEAKDTYTSGHSERVAEMSVNLARRLNLSDNDINVIHIAAHLHDIGKAGVAE